MAATTFVSKDGNRQASMYEVGETVTRVGRNPRTAKIVEKKWSGKEGFWLYLLDYNVKASSSGRNIWSFYLDLAKSGN